MAEFEIGSDPEKDPDYVPDLYAAYDIGQNGNFGREGIFELTRLPRSLVGIFLSNPLPFNDESLLAYSQSVCYHDPKAFQLFLEGEGAERTLILRARRHSIYRGITLRVMNPKTTRVIDQERSGIYRVGTLNTISLYSPESKVGDLTLLNDPDVDFQINPPSLSTEETSSSKIVIDLWDSYAGKELTVLIFKNVTSNQLLPDLVVIDRVGEPVRKRVRRELWPWL